MQKFCFINGLLLLFTLSCSFMPPKNSVVLKIKVLYTASYCGGVAPTEEILAEHEKEKPYTNRTLIVKKYQENALKAQAVVARVVTDAEGFCTLSLPKGKYGLITEEKNQDYSVGIMAKFGNSQPCTDWQNRADIVVEMLKSSKKAKTYSFHEGCNPCLPPRP